MHRPRCVWCEHQEGSQGASSSSQSLWWCRYCFQGRRCASWFCCSYSACPSGQAHSAPICSCHCLYIVADSLTAPTRPHTQRDSALCAPDSDQRRCSWVERCHFLAVFVDAEGSAVHKSCIAEHLNACALLLVHFSSDCIAVKHYSRPCVMSHLQMLPFMMLSTG